MLEILQNIINVLKADATLTAIVPAKNMFVGPIDVTVEAQSELLLPQINIHIVSEVGRSVPSNVRDTMVQIDIWDRDTILNTINAYERIVSLLNYTSPVQGSTKIFWERLGGASDQYESDRRIFHRSVTYACWSQKP